MDDTEVFTASFSGSLGLEVGWQAPGLVVVRASSGPGVCTQRAPPLGSVITHINNVRIGLQRSQDEFRSCANMLRHFQHGRGVTAVTFLAPRTAGSNAAITQTIAALGERDGRGRWVSRRSLRSLSDAATPAAHQLLPPQPQLGAADENVGKKLRKYYVGYGSPYIWLGEVVAKVSVDTYTVRWTNRPQGDIEEVLPKDEVENAIKRHPDYQERAAAVDNEEATCVICLEVLTDSTKSFSACGHRLHARCMDELVQSNPAGAPTTRSGVGLVKCPVCRRLSRQ